MRGLHAKFLSLRQRFASRPALLPILATVPRSGTWFIRYSMSFYWHLERGGRISDRVTGQTHGDPAGPPFDFESFRGGPLFSLRAGRGPSQIFVGHTVCPGFRRIAARVPWWNRTPFHAGGYDYLHEGMNYEFTPIEFGRDRHTSIFPEAIDEAPWIDARQRMVLVYREPVSQARSYLQFSKTHVDPEHRKLDGRWLEEIDFADYLFGAALPSYAKQFVSYQSMAECLPDQVRLVAYEHLMEEPARILAGILNFLTGARSLDGMALRLAVHLARQEHLQAIEREIGQSLDGTRARSGSHIQRLRERAGDRTIDLRLHARAAEWLCEHGIAPSAFVWPGAVASPQVKELVTAGPPV